MKVQMELDRKRKEIKMDTNTNREPVSLKPDNRIKELTVSIKLNYNETDKKFWFFCNELPCYGYGRTFEKAYDAMCTATISYINALIDGGNWEHVCDFYNLDPGICWMPSLHRATIKVVKRESEAAPLEERLVVGVHKQNKERGHTSTAALTISDEFDEED